jgi:magnesium chelatase family protein
VVIVGLPDKAVTESRDRVKTALENSGFRHVRTRTTVNLAPADLKKEGPVYDLPMALGILSATEQLPLPRISDFLVLGVLGLNGKVRSTRGVLSMALLAKQSGKKGVIVPAENALEASMVQGLEVYGTSSLRECAEFLAGRAPIPSVAADLEELLGAYSHYDVDFSEVKGQLHAKRALEIAVAGGHNVLLVGPPGSGKSMLCKRLPTIFPSMTIDEALETTRIHSVAGTLPSQQALIATRPFRSPHHTISDVALTGGTADLRPGEVSLSHHGILFLDELPEFKRAALEAMRQPLEDGVIHISRATGSVSFPARFMLVAAMNPCPCGFLGHPKKECRCSPAQIQRYRNKVSGPLLDRIDMHVEVPSLPVADLGHTKDSESSDLIRQRVIAARHFQYERYKKPGRINSQMSQKGIKVHCALSSESEAFLKSAVSEMNFSARAYHRILKVARTIADLKHEPTLQTEHLSEALQYRALDRNLWS